LSVVINEDEELIIRKRVKLGDRAGRFSCSEQSNARDWKSIYAGKKTLC
jgi:hypothetical protein